jgi:hypothetical protein
VPVIGYVRYVWYVAVVMMSGDEECSEEYSDRESSGADEDWLLNVH